MIPAVRSVYNEQFTEEKYQAFLKELSYRYPGELDFRVAETPVFISKQFTEQLLHACNSIVDIISSSTYKAQSRNAIPDEFNVPNEDEHPQFIAFDFGICENDKGELEPQLIEMQGFPSMFAWQVILPDVHAKHFSWPDNYSPYLNGFDRQSYIELLRKIIIGDSDSENVILLEIFPERQKTRVDFHATRELVGINFVSLTDVTIEGRKLYYSLNDRRIRIDRIYNRVIFDELLQQDGHVQEKGKIFQHELDVTWVPHPNWFYRLSKYTLPFINHPNVPETKFLSDLRSIPADLENYVVKPLFSFAGQGVIIDVTNEDIEKIRNPHEWIIQRKVRYAAAIETPDEPAKAEIRIFYFWPPGAEKPIATNNLSRLSKGKMVGVRYNKDKTWVGGSFCLFEQ